VFVKIGDLHREILAEIETHVDDAKCLGKKSNEKCLCQKKHEKQGETLGFCRVSDEERQER
jgi:hypothetical protein